MKSLHVKQLLLLLLLLRRHLYRCVASTLFSLSCIKRRSAVSRRSRYSILRFPFSWKGRKEEENSKEKDNFLWV